MPETLLNNAQRWGFGVLAQLTLSTIEFLAALFFIWINKFIGEDTFQLCIKFFFALACGSLLGDCLIHVIPQTFQSQHTNKLAVSIIYILTILFFVVLERLLIYFNIGHQHWVGQVDHNHDHQQGGQHNHDQEKNNFNNQKVQKHGIQQENLEVKQDDQSNCCSQWKGKGAFGYVNIIGSTLHSFIDGLTIGLAFSTGKLNSIQTTLIAIFSHEIPRQLGDVAILIENGFSKCQALISNSTINFTSVVGTLIGLTASSFSPDIQQYIMTFIGGNFIVIASDIWRNLFKQSWRRNLLQFFGFFIGVGIMILVKVLQKHEHTHSD